MLDPEAETRPPVHLDPESAEATEPALKPRQQQIAEGPAAGEDIDTDILLEQRAELARMQEQAAAARRRGRPDTALERRIGALRMGIDQLEQQIATARQAAAAEEGRATTPAAPEPEGAGTPPRLRVDVPDEQTSPVRVRVEAEDAPESSRQRALDEAEAIEEAATAEGRAVQVIRVGKSGTAAGIEGAEFRGDALAAPRADAADEASRAAQTLVQTGSTASFATIAGNDPTQLRVKPATGGNELTVRITTTDSMHAGDDGVTPVARFRYHAETGEYEILVSTRAPEGTLERALAHELTEIRATHGQADIPDALRPGGFGSGLGRARGQPELSPHDRGRLAEIEVLSRQIEAAQQRDDSQHLARLRDESQRLLAHLGLIDDTPAARARLEAVQGELADRPAARRLLDTEVEAARNNPFLRLPPTEPRDYVEFLADRLNYARRLGDEGRAGQVLEQARALISFSNNRNVQFNFPDGDKRVAYSIEVLRKLAADPQATHTQRARALAEIAQYALERQRVRQDPFAQPRRVAPPDPTHLDPDTASAVRRRYSDQRFFQDWETFQKQYGITSRSTAAEVQRAFRLWAAGYYVSSPGRTASLIAAARVPDIEALAYVERPEPKAQLPPGTNEETILQRIIELQAELETTTNITRREEIAAELQNLPSLKRASEDIGEASAIRVAQLRYGVDPSQITISRGVGIPDLIFTDPATNRLVVVEAKGGESPLGARLSVDGDQMVQQGTREYLESLAQAMQRSSDADVVRQGRELERKLVAGEVDYLLVRQPYARDDGTLETPLVAEFDISRGGRPRQ